jgi:uncharacterized protein YjiS (DUF1127 family)
MSTISLGFMTLLPHRLSHFCNKMRHGVSTWRHHERSHHELLGLSDRCLRDIGVSRRTSNYDACKPFWMA